MTSIILQPDRRMKFSPPALQQNRREIPSDIAAANTECGCTDTAKAYAARGVVYGLLISAPLWVIIGGAVFLACKMIG